MSEGIGKDLVAASATPMVLSLLSGGESYGYELIQKVRELSGGELTWTDGMLYPVLQRLERRGLISSKWKVADTGRRRRYYRITTKGKRELSGHKRQWQVVVGSLNQLWGASHV